MINDLENMLGRKLTDNEARKIRWLQQWDKDTIDVFHRLFEDLFLAKPK